MAEYIEREATLHRMKVDIKPPFAVVRDMPAADVVEVRNGRWVQRQFADEPTSFGFRCSECHLTFDVNSNYCPNCGAKMDGGTNE